MKRTTRFAAALLTAVTVFAAVFSAGAVYASDEPSAQEALEQNQSFWDAEEASVLGIQNHKIPDAAYELSNKIVGDETDPYKKAKLIYDWFCENVQYSPTLYTMDATFYDVYTGVCRDFSQAFCEVCWAQNIPCVDIYGTTWQYGEEDRHAWNAFYANGEWHFADTTWGAAGQENYFDLDMEELSVFPSGKRLFGNVLQTADFGAWAKEDLLNAYQAGLIPSDCAMNWTFRKTISYTGTDLTQNCTRGDFAHLAVALLEACCGHDINAIMADKGVTPGTFTDTADEAVLAANALGIVNGYGDGTYGPNDSLKRQEAAAILARTAGLLGLEAESSDLSVFTDLPQIEAWAQDAVAFCKAAGVMQGTSSTTFSPLSPYTREQCVVTMWRLYEAAQD